MKEQATVEEMPEVRKTGLRERKKQRTRAAIVDAAMELFTTHGFERVTVAEIARRAEVSEATVFNYFRSKEDLVYSGLEDFWSRALAAVADRGLDETALGAFRRFILGQRPMAETPEQARRLAAITRMIVNSPALRAREREAYDQGAQALAEVIAGRRPPRIEERVTAYALVGLHRVLVDYTREQVLAGVHGRLLTRRVSAQARRAFAALEAGLPAR
jgi:AcrR family transcriptional regulator